MKTLKFSYKEDFKISNHVLRESIFQVGGLNIKLNIEDQFEKELIFKALEKRKSLLQKVNDSFIISKKRNDSFLIQGTHTHSIKLNELSKIIEHLSSF